MSKRQQKCSVCGKEMKADWTCIMNASDNSITCCECEGEKPDLIMFFRVYQDVDGIANRGLSYVDTKEGIENSLSHWRESYLGVGEDMPVIEPILMTKDSFENLPEFDGY